MFKKNKGVTLVNFKEINWKKYLDKKYWKFYAIALAGIVLSVVLVVVLSMGGNQIPEETTPQSTTQTTTETTTPQEGEILPEGHIKLTSVSIVSGDSAAELTAAADLQKYLTQKGVTVSEAGGFPITLSIDANLGDDAYTIDAVVGEDKTEGLSIVGGNGRGILYGVYRFLEDYAAVRFFTPDLEVCEAGDVIIFDGLTIDYTPTFELRQTDWYKWISDGSGYTWAAKSGINIVSGWSYSWGEELGGSLTYAPSMFVHTIGKLAELDTPYPATAPNPCLTDENTYNTVLANVRKIMAETPTAKILSISQNDNTGYCKCENCQAIDKEEGSPAGTLLRFVNRIANEIADEYPELTIDTLAYRYTLNAPKVTKPAPNVCVRLSTITCHFTHPITTSSCSACDNFCRAIEDWSKICDNLYIWDYTTNYSYYLATFPNFHVLRENMKFFAQHNVKGVYEQGNASGPSGEFGELRAYLIGKLLMNPYMSNTEYYAHMDEFLAAYYGEGWQNIRQYINTYTQYAKMSTSGMGLYNYPFGVLSKDSLKSLKDKFNSWWDAAEAQAGDRLEYVQRSRWQLRYLLLYVEPDKTEAEKLVAEVEGNGTKWSEKFPKLLWYVYEYDLLSQSPDAWFTDPS